MEASSELQNIIRGWFESVARGDATWLDRHLSTDPRLRIVGTDPNEWLLGEDAANLLRSDLGNLAGVTLDIREVEAYTQGDIGWGIAAFTILLGELKISPRWSAVFTREDGDWRAIQIHASVGVTNEQLFGG